MTTLVPSPWLLPSETLLPGVAPPVVVHPVTVRVRDRFPLAYQDADDQSGQPLLRWLSVLWDQAGEVSNLLDRIDIQTVDQGGAPGAVSALIDPDQADDRWLPWLGQLLGFTFPSRMPAEAMRAALRTSTFQRGTVPTIIAVARRYLRPGAPVTVTKVDQWHYTVTVAQADILGLTWDQLAVGYPTWADVAAAFPTWADFTADTPNLRLALAQEKPAGMVLTVTITT